MNGKLQSCYSVCITAFPRSTVDGKSTYILHSIVFHTVATKNRQLSCNMDTEHPIINLQSNSHTSNFDWIWKFSNKLNYQILHSCL